MNCKLMIWIWLSLGIMQLEVNHDLCIHHLLEDFFYFGLNNKILLSLQLRDFSMYNIGAIHKRADLTKKLLVLSDEELRELVCQKVCNKLLSKF